MKKNFLKTKNYFNTHTFSLFILFSFLFSLFLVSPIALSQPLEDINQLFSSALLTQLQEKASDKNISLQVVVLTNTSLLSDEETRELALEEIDTFTHTNFSCLLSLVFSDKNIFLSQKDCEINNSFLQTQITFLEENNRSIAAYRSFTNNLLDHIPSNNPLLSPQSQTTPTPTTSNPPTKTSQQPNQQNEFFSYAKEKLSKKSTQESASFEESSQQRKQFSGPINTKKLFIYLVVPLSLLVFLFTFYIKFLKKPKRPTTPALPSQTNLSPPEQQPSQNPSPTQFPKKPF